MAFDVQGALKAGYSAAEVADFLASQNEFDIAGARAAGYSDDEILGHLSTGAPAPRTEPATATTSAAITAEPIQARAPAQGPELRSYEPSLFQRFTELVSSPNRDRAAVEYGARQIAKEQGLSVGEVYRQAGGSRAIFNPEGRNSLVAGAEAAQIVAGEVPKIPAAAANTALRAIQGGDVGEADRGSLLDRMIAATKTDAPPGEFQDPNYESFNNLGKSFGYSLTTLVSSAIAVAGGTAAAGPVGGVASASVASTTVSYRASKNEFLERVRDKLDAESKQVFGSPLSAQEWAKAKQDYESAAIKYGAWEAIPETVSNLIFLRAFGAPLKTASADKIQDFATRAIRSAGVSYAPENITETITGMGQNAAEREAGLTTDQLSIRDAFKQQAIPTAFLTGGTAATAAGVRKGAQIYDERVLPAVAPNQAFAKALEADVAATTNAQIDAGLAEQNRRRASEDALYNAPDVGSAIAAADQLAGSVDELTADVSAALDAKLRSSPAIPLPVAVAPITEPEPIEPPTPAADPAVETQFGLDTLRLDAQGLPAGAAAPTAPRPQRIAGTRTDSLTDAQLQQIIEDDTASAIARRGASIELTARRTERGGSREPNQTTERVEPTLDVEQLAAIEPDVAGRIDPTISNNFLAAPAIEGVWDVSVAPVGGQSAAASARGNAQAAIDAWAQRTGQPSPASLTAPSSPELESAVNGIAQLVNSQFAGRIYAFNDSRPEALSGVAIGGVAFVNTANVEVNAARTSLHEFKHTVEQIARAETAQGLANTPAQQFVAQIDSIYNDMTEAGKRAYLENFLAKAELDAIADPAAREARIQELLTDPLTRSEMTADFLGNRATDKQFWKSVAAADPQGFQGFVEKWLKAIDNLIQALRGTKTQGRKESALVDKYVRDLNKAKMVAREALVAYSKATRAPGPVAPGQPAASARQTFGGIRVPGYDSNANTGALDERTADTRAGEGVPEAAAADGRVTGRDGAGEIPEYGTAREGAVSVVGRHYSTGQRQTLSGDFYGRGLRGAERSRLDGSPDPRLRQRVYFYVDQGSGVRPESGVGGYAHEVRLNNIYDPASRIIPPQPDSNAFESAVLNAGFDGYIAPFGNNQAAAVLLGPKHKAVPVRAMGQVASAPAPQAAAPTTLKKSLLGRELSAIDPARISGAQVRMGNLEIPADQAEAANAELERIGSDARFSARQRGLKPEVADAVDGIKKVAASLTETERAKLRKDTGEKMVAIYKALPSSDEIAAVAYAGKAKRGWYRHSVEAIQHTFGEDGWRFAGLLAATSPQTPVEVNLENTLRIWKNWIAAGRPTDNREILTIMGRSVQGTKGEDSVLGSWRNNTYRALTSQDFSDLVLSGPKVDSFMRNLNGNYVEVTNDAWMANYALVDQTLFSGSANKAGTEPGKGAGYLAMSAKTREAAKKLGWQPAEVQETVWSWAMSMLETMDRAGETRGAIELLQQGALTDDVINATPDFRTLFRDPRYADILDSAGYGDRVATLTEAVRDEDAGRAPFSPEKMDRLLADAGLRLEFLQRQRRTNVQVSWEARPGESTGILPGMHTAPLEQQQEYLADIFAAIERAGFTEKMGFSLRNTLFGPSAWEGKVLAGAQTLSRPGVVADNQGGLVVDPETRKKLELVASVLGLALRQEGVYWHYPVYKDSKADSENGIEANFGRSLTNPEMQRLYDAISKRAGHSMWAPANTPTGVRILNFTNTPHKDFHRSVISAITQFMRKFDGSVEIKLFSADGDAIENDWKEAPNGQSYIQRISQAKRPDLLEWADGQLQAEVDAVNRDFSERYGWGAATLQERDQNGTEEIASLEADEDAPSFSSRQVTPLGFYSPLGRAVEQAKIDNVPAQQWKNWLLNNAPQLQVKKDEIQWSGITDYLDLRGKDKVTKAEIADYLSGNGVRVEDVVKGAKTKSESYADQLDSMDADAFRSEVEREFGIDTDGLDFENGSADRDDYTRELVSNREAYAGQHGYDQQKPDTKFSGYWDSSYKGGIPGTYREILVTLPRRVPEQEFASIAQMKAWLADNPRPDLIGMTDLDAFKAINKERRKAGDQQKAFQSSHWKEKNVLVHVRLDEVIGADGKRYVRVGEVQSDWGQQGKKEGFKGAVQYAKGMEGQEDGFLGLNASGPPAAPFVTDTKAWVALGIKRALMHAMDVGADGVVFGTGQQNADLYDLSKQVDTIYAGMAADGKYLIGADNGNNRDVIDTKATKEELPALVGKELAEKIIRDVTDEDTNAEYRGLDLKVGGEGMKSFYDQIVPSVANEVLKKLGGGKVGRVDFPAGKPTIEKAGSSYYQVPSKVQATTQPGFPITPAMREKVSDGVPLFSPRQADTWSPIGRDAGGRIRFGTGAKAYRLVADIANNVLDKVRMKPISTELSRGMRLMKVEIEKMQTLTAGVAAKLNELPEAERQMISDVIEGELKAGVTPPARVLALAASMQSIMSEQSAELVRLGMLTPEAANRWEGKYLPRFYEQKIGDEVKAWARAARALLGRKKTMQGIKGDSLKARGMFRAVPVDELQSWLGQGWEARDPNFDPATDTEITIWRDFTRAERDQMGEIRDAMFRFVMGYNRSQRDIALGRLYEKINDTLASRTQRDGYVQVPTTLVEGTNAKRYGMLAGRWVPREVLDHLSAFDTSMQNDLAKIYRKGLSMWKEGKTVLNPVAHFNNTVSNLTMAHFAGVSYWDAGKYAGAVRDLMRNAPMLQEAKDAGLFVGTFNQAELMNNLPPQLKALAGMSESRLKKGVDLVWNAMSFGVRKPAAKMYEAEDLFFRYLIYRDARQRGVPIDDAVEWSQQFIFTYDDLPQGARMVRDAALPFFAYTYKVVPVLVRTAMEYPWRFAAPAAALYTLNAVMYAMAAGDEDEDWMSIVRRYVSDKEFRDKAKDLEAYERENLPPWMKGHSFTLGVPKAIRLGMDDVTNLPLFLDVMRVFPGGDLLDSQANAGGVPLLQPITPSNPVLNTLGAMLWNKDPFFGRDIVEETDTRAEATEKRAKWLWQQYAPAIAVGNYHWDRALNAIANATGEEVLGYTGVGKDGLPVQPGLAVAQTLGVKVRPLDLDMSAQITRSQRQRMIRDLDAQIRRINRLEGRGALSADQAERERERQIEKRQLLREGLTVDGDEP